MGAWSIGEVARLLGVKPHVIRYWESELPLLSPKKGLTGRREYSSNDVRLLMRFRHLLYERKFTIEGAKRRMWEELGGTNPDVAARFARIRSDLIEALMTVRRGAPAPHEGELMIQGDIREKLEAMGQEHLFAHWEKTARGNAAAAPGGSLVAGPCSRGGDPRDHLRWPGEPAGAPSSEREIAPAPYVALSASAERRRGTRERRGRNPPRAHGVSHRRGRAGIPPGVRRAEGDVPGDAAAEDHAVRPVRGKAHGGAALVRRGHPVADHDGSPEPRGDAKSTSRPRNGSAWAVTRCTCSCRAACPRSPPRVGC